VFFILVGVGILLFQGYATIRLCRYAGYSIRQKVAQLLLIWLVPFCGALIVASVIGLTERGARRRNEHFVADKGGNPPGI
jgi:hypothetical protein